MALTVGEPPSKDATPDAPPVPTPSKSTKTTKWPVVLIGVITGLLALHALGLQLLAPRWEYSIESPDDLSFEETMETLGQDGWELVFARRATSRGRGSASYEMIFKRRRALLSPR